MPGSTLVTAKTHLVFQIMGCLVSSNNFSCKDLDHPIKTTLQTMDVSGSGKPKQPSAFLCFKILGWSKKPKQLQ